MSRIHPTAIIEPGAELGAEVDIGPYVVVGPHVRIGDRTRIAAHALITGHTTIGADNRIFSSCSIGEVPQDMKYRDEPTRLVIGDRNTIRECCTFNIGTVQQDGVTTFGSDNWVMAYVHVAHDVVVGNHCVLANAVTLAGHVTVGDHVTIGGLSGVHQFCRIGTQAMVGGMTKIVQDVAPYITVDGNPAEVHGLNLLGLRRRGFSNEEINQLKKAQGFVWRDGLTLDEARLRLAELAAETGNAHVQTLLDFVSVAGRGLVR
ncbi:acyl-ACP--UDP-N-acetylglucosamine O-acyltransferase [Derxia lacustris]|uniref:acyl-ACP--UDP-N-acetylglucosamine O-acyltransferase n=1 Tax=Derxia lacustris TaxID=764842 RepID=UPI000A16E09A|nr:acyl-ACP--UDP-N-acetylglucosamine O-acyltransferase [Derxia lacustris]